jgi:hypothetical protein
MEQLPVVVFFALVDRYVDGGGHGNLSGDLGLSLRLVLRPWLFATREEDLVFTQVRFDCHAVITY